MAWLILTVGQTGLFIARAARIDRRKATKSGCKEREASKPLEAGFEPITSVVGVRDVTRLELIGLSRDLFRVKKSIKTKQN